MKPFVRFKNTAVTLNIAISYVQPLLSQPLQSPINNSILHYVTCNAVRSGYIYQRELIIDYLNIKIVTDGYSTITPL